MASQVGAEQAGVFRAHEAILHDPAFTAKVRERIVDHREAAPAALEHVLGAYTALFTRMEDEYLRERLVDVRDVIIRLSEHLSPMLAKDPEGINGPIILVANELFPSQVVALGKREVAGIVTQSGGRPATPPSWPAAAASPRSAAWPAFLRNVKNGDTVVVDGSSGHVIVNPDAESESAYRKLQREFVHLKDVLAENRDLPAVTADGTALDLLANINSVDDARKALGDGRRRRGAVPHRIPVPHASRTCRTKKNSWPPIAPLSKPAPTTA